MKKLLMFKLTLKRDNIPDISVLSVYMYYSVFIADQDLSHVVGDDDEAYDYKFVKWMVKEKVDWVYLLLLPTMYITYLF